MVLGKKPGNADPRRSGSLQKNQFQISLVAKRAEGSKWLRSRICHLRENLRPSLSRRSSQSRETRFHLGSSAKFPWLFF